MTVEREPNPAFWAQQCPERGFALKHAHSTFCAPKTASHEGHVSDQCCHCGMRSSLWNPAPPARTFEDDEPLALAQPVSDGCTISHDRITTKRLIGDEGEEWSKCPSCGAMVEPRVATGIPDGPTWGKGRGAYMTQRLRNALSFIKWLASRGEA
ncbi:MAG TPA: hypothetical protein VFI40_04915 [Nocardioides sp.]|nr:hypothetical protein [Nocardioides sp.]